MNGIDEHIFQSADGKWHFWDETGSNAFGPYDSREAARDALVEYARGLEEGLPSD